MKNKQRGVVLIITMIVLVLMCLAALALIKTDSLSTLLSGTVASRSAGNEFTFSPLEDRIQAIAALVAEKSTELNTASAGYSPVYLDEDNEKGIPKRLMEGKIDTKEVLEYDASIAFSGASSGNTAYVVVERLCSTASITDDNMKTNCVGEDNSGSGTGAGADSSRKGGNIHTFRRKSGISTSQNVDPFQIAYRITIRVDGANGARSFTQAYVYI
jgi:hypothetical protein